VIAVAACRLGYRALESDESVTMHVYPSRAVGEPVRASWDKHKGKGLTVWAGNTLVLFESKAARTEAEAFAAGDVFDGGPSSS
jgi:hypothetical protein